MAEDYNVKCGKCGEKVYLKSGESLVSCGMTIKRENNAFLIISPVLAGTEVG